MEKERTFTSYQIFLITVLAVLQFSVILDFMVLSPLGAQLMPKLHIDTSQFGLVVSAYAFSAGASGLLAAGFADRFDRKTLLLFFYAGFILGTFLCSIAPSYPLLLAARIVTGIFGGVIGSVGFAIITDLFQMQVRGRVMGFVQMAFAASQVLGIPVGLYLSNQWDWHAPFLLIVGLSIPLWVLILWKMEPVRAHLAIQKDHTAFEHLIKTVSRKFYIRAFAATTLLATGGFMLMPFGTAFAVNNLGVQMSDLPLIYLVTGISSLILGPLIGKLTDNIGPMRVFAGGSLLGSVMVVIYCHLGVTPLVMLLCLNVVLWMGITARMISSSALMSGVPAPADRGAFMGVNSSISQISGGFASALAGIIIHQNPDGKLENYPMLGWVVATTMAICVALMFFIDRAVSQQRLVASMAGQIV